MTLKTRATARNFTGGAKGGASAFGDAQQQALEAARDARKRARRQVTRARIAAARARAGGKARASGISSKAVGAAGAAGLAAGYFLDPDSGRRRRNVARDRTVGLIRRGARKARRDDANDQTLAERVRSEIFQPADAPKESVSVNVENGVVYLRGEVKRPDEIKKLVKDAESVDGVRGVENLLHTP